MEVTVTADSSVDSFVLEMGCSCYIVPVTCEEPAHFVTGWKKSFCRDNFSMQDIALSRSNVITIGSFSQRQQNLFILF